MSVDAKAVKAAVKARKRYIIDNLNTMTLKSCRQTLEEDMGLEPGSLKPFKDLLNHLLDKLIKRGTSAEAADGKPEALPASTKKDIKAARAAQSDAQNAVEDSQPRKRQKSDKQPSKTSGPRQYGRAVEKLRGICKAATITIPPNLYVKNKTDEALQAALEALLDRHGLDINSGEREVQKARSKLQVQRDLDGIDTSNIIQGGRSRRAAAPASFAQLVEPASDDDEEEQESDSQGEEEDGEEAEVSGSDAEPDAQEDDDEEQQSAAKLRRGESSVEADDSDAESAEEQQEQPRARAGKARTTKKSPDENTGAKSNGGSSRKDGKKSTKARPAGSMEDSDEEQPSQQKGKRRVMADWSDEDD